MTTNPFGNLPTTGGGGILGTPTTPGSSTNPFASYGPAVAAAYTKALNANGGNAQGLNTQAAQNAAYAAMTPTQQQQYSTAVAKSNSAGGFFNTFNKYAPDLIIGTAAALSGGAAASAIGGLGGAVAGGATAGAINTAGNDALTGKPLTAGSVGTGAAVGGVTGGLGYAAAPAASALNNATGIGSTASNALVKGGIGAGLGALGAKVSGGNVSNAALSGGVAGAVSGAVTSATGSNLAGKAAAGLGGAAISPLLSSGSGGSTIGNIGNGTGMAGLTSNGGGSALGGTSTDTTLAGAITGALPGLLQAGAGAYGAQNAAEAVTNADQAAIGTQQTNLGNINSIWGTQQKLGQGADTALGSALGTNGQPANYSNFMNMPGYQFAVQQGTQAIQRQAASLGNAYTPNTSQAIGQYVTGTAAQDYNTYISQLMGAAGLGTTANQGLQTGSQQSSNNISQLQQNQGQAQAYGISGVSNAVGGLFGANGAGTGLIGAGANYLTGGSNGGGMSGGTGSGVSGGDINPTTGTNPGDTYNSGSNFTYDANGNIIGQGATNGSGVFGTGVGSDSSSWLNGYDTSSAGSSASDILNNGFGG